MSFPSQSVLSTEAMVDVEVALLKNSIEVLIVDGFEILLRNASYDKIVHGCGVDIWCVVALRMLQVPCHPL